jgi:hypothetical protein
MSEPAYKASTSNDPNEVICDLSEHFEALANYEDISDRLTAEQEAKIVDYIRACMEMSAAQISKRYSAWDAADAAHDVYVDPDATDFREKAVIPDTRAIADTVLTYMMAALTGRNPMFQLEGLNRKSRMPSLIIERILHQSMRRTAGEARVAQLLLDGIRYGLSPTKVVWDAKSNQNHIINYNPRRFFPDPRVNWGDWEDMNFVGFADYVSYEALVRTGLYPKLAKYPALRRKSTNANRAAWKAHHFVDEDGQGLRVNPQNPAQTGEVSRHWNIGSNRVVDEMWLVLEGWQIGVPRVGSMYFVVTVIDEEVVIRLQANPYGRQFPMVIGSLFQDVHKTFGQSLYDILLPLHDIATWLLRSRVDNVQAAMSNLIFVDPNRVSVPDLIDRNPYGVVRSLQGAAPGDGVFIANIPDVTRGHWDDINILSELKQRTSAASDAQQGMPTPDVRTATEIQRLTQLGSQRLGVLSRVTSATTMRPMVRMMISNIQDSLSYNGSIRINEDSMPTQLASMVEDGYLDFDVLKDLQGDIDYLVIDGTLPIEPTRNAQTWIDMLQVLSQTGLMMEYNIGRIAEEGIRSMGVTDLDRFRISKEELQQGLTPSQELALLEKQRGVSSGSATVKPAEQVSREVERGNLIPARPQ